MKLLVIGVGDCGCRLAGEFAQLNKRARSEQRVSIVSHAYAVNNDEASLTAIIKGNEGLQPVFIKGTLKDKSSESGAELMREEGDRVMAAMSSSEFFETDAFLFIAGAAGSLGSGGIPVMAQRFKERYVGKPIYGLIVLPFQAEEADPRYIYNVAISLKSINKVADAVFLIDNEKFKTSGDINSNESIAKTNKHIANLFYGLLCASETAGTPNAGANTLGVGDMMQTLSSWSAIGVGRAELETSKLRWGRTRNFLEKGSETIKAMEAMNMALSLLSIDSRLEDAGRALYLLSAPITDVNVDMTKSLGSCLRELTSDAEIRGGNFYGTKDSIQVTVVVSQLAFIDKVKDYYDRAVSLSQKLTGEKRDD